jgi:hypothetical protein
MSLKFNLRNVERVGNAKSAGVWERSANGGNAKQVENKNALLHSPKGTGKEPSSGGHT